MVFNYPDTNVVIVTDENIYDCLSRDPITTAVVVTDMNSPYRHMITTVVM